MGYIQNKLTKGAEKNFEEKLPETMVTAFEVQQGWRHLRYH